MSVDFNVNQIPYRFFGDKLISTDKSNNLIIESSSNNIELKSNTKNFIFNNNIIFNYGLNLNNIDLSNIRSISAKTLNTNTLFLRNKERSQTSIEDAESIENGYIRATTIGNTISGSSNAYFTYINVSGGDSSFNNSVYIKDRLTVNGTTSISNDLIVNGKSFVTLYNTINNYIVNNSQQLVSAKIVTNDLSATNISISNDLVVGKTSFINDLTISGQMLNNVLKVPSVFTIDPSGHGNASGTLIINGDLMVYGNNTIIASSNVEISDVAISVATNLNNKNNLIGNSAGLDISNVASLKYNGTLWNFSGGQVSVENKRVALDVSFIEFRSYSEASFISLNSDIDLSFGQLKNNIDNSYNAIYSRRQIDNSFLLITTFDLSKVAFESSIDNSYVTKLAFDGSFSTLKTYLDASYIIKSTSTNLNIIDSSLIILSRKLDFSYVSNSVFEGSFNNLKNQIDNSFASISITITSLNTSSISVETINTKHHSQRFNNISWNQFGQDLTNNNNKTAISNDGKVVAYSKLLYSVLNPTQVEQAVTNWTNKTIPTEFSAQYIAGVAWSPSLRIFAVVGYGTNNKRAMYSYDGSYWLSGSINTSFGNFACKSICWSPERSMFVALVGENSSPSNNYKVMTSYDGKNWTESTVSDILRSNWWAHICWSPELRIFVAVADTGDYKIMTSPDGINWTHILSSFGIARLTSICWSAQLGIFVTINLFGSEVYTSEDGSSWTKYAFPQEVISTYKQSICWSPQLELFVAVGSAGTYRIITSRNGTDWTPVYSLGEGGGGGLFFVDWIPALNLFIALRSFANDTQSVLTSPDGQNWTPRDVPSPGGWFYGAWSQELGILVATSSSGKIMTSSVTTPFITEPAGRVYVYELSNNQTSSSWNQLGLSSEIIVGASNEDQFGWDIALSSNGRVVAVSSIASDALGTNSGQVRLFELSNNNRWVKKGSDINGPRPGSESGYSISLAGSGNSIAIGAWKDNLNGTNAGAVRVYDFSASINDWRQKGQTIAGVSGSFEGYSTALSLDGQTLATGCFSVNNANNIANAGQVKIFTISGSTWIPKGIIQGPDISNSYFGRSIKLSGNGNAIVIGALGYSPTSVFQYNSSNFTIVQHTSNALNNGMTFASILNAEENEQVRKLLVSVGAPWAFIGGIRRPNSIAGGITSNDWQWINGDIWSYTKFRSGEPNSTAEPNIHFVTSDNAWNDTGATSSPAVYKGRSLNVGQAYVYGYQGGTTWTQLGQTIREISGSSEFGSSVNISNDGTIISVGTNDISSNRGYVNVYKYVNNYWTQISNRLNGNVAIFKAGIHALAGDGTTLIQSDNNYYNVYGINKLLTLNSPMTTISGNLIVMGSMSVNSLDISTNHVYSSNGYSYKMFNSVEATAIMKEYYSDVTSSRHLKVQIRGDGNITNRNNSFSSLSDSRLKENIVTSGPKLEDLLKVRVVNYNLKGSNSTNYIGVLAQELEELFPNLVTEIEPSPKDVEEGRTIRYKAVNYSSFDSILIKALQEQNAMLKNITQRIEALEAALE
jgi:hypothetical protein